MANTNPFKVLVTAEEAWPEFEKRVLAATSEVSAGFRIFDLSTPLKSAEARKIGTDWWDLLLYTLNRGVRIRIILCDFDPVLGTDLHEMTWRSMRQAAALAEVARLDPGQLEVIPALHPARAGSLMRLALLPALLQKLKSKLRDVRGTRRKRQAVGLDPGSWPDLHTVTHHQKLAVIDREWLYIGGLDINARRDDSPMHQKASSQTWADIQLLLKGPEAEEAAQHLDDCLDITAGRKPVRAGVAIRRTLSAPRKFAAPFLSPRNLAREIEQDHLDAIAGAQSLVYIETQFLRSSRISNALVRAAQDRPGLRLILVLPSLPDDVAFEGNRGLDARYGMSLQARAIQRIDAAFGDRATIATPVQPADSARDTAAVLHGSPVVHVHSKALIVDNTIAMVGSANLNGRSMRWDTEVSLRINETDRIAEVRDRLFRHWWFGELPPTAFDPATAQIWWDREVKRNTLRRPEVRSGFLVRHDPTRLENYHRALPGVTENVV